MGEDLNQNRGNVHKTNIPIHKVNIDFKAVFLSVPVQGQARPILE